MRTTLYKNAKIYTAFEVIENGQMLVDESGKIVDLSSSIHCGKDIATVDLAGKTITPGFIDVHIHGGKGYEVMAGTYEDLNQISRFHAEQGTTSFLSSTGAAPKETIIQALEASAVAVVKGVAGAEVLGIHLEGPFINEKRRGAMEVGDIRRPDLAEMDDYIEASKNQIKFVTLAPEVEGGLELVDYLHERGIMVSIGHSDATYIEVIEAIQHGVRHTTHHFNGMSPLHHREPGVAGSGLMLPELTLELIADGIHVHPQVIRFMYETKGAWNICVITDAVGSTGLPDGIYHNVKVEGGKIFLKDHPDTLAGSSLTMIKGLQNVLEFTSLPLEQVLPSFTMVPAQKAQADDRKGSLEIGKDADFLVLDDKLDILSTYVKGKAVFTKKD